MAQFDLKREVVVEVMRGNLCDETPLDLENVMTQAAFAHEYALMELNDYASYSQKEEILAQLDHYKETYFWAREQLEQVSPEKLQDLEESLRQQKENIFKLQTVIH